MAEKIIKVRGMHCKSCEVLLESKIREIPGVSKVRASVAKGEVAVSGNGIKPSSIESAIISAGYEPGSEQVGTFTKDAETYLDFVLSFLIIMIIYVVYQLFSFEKLLPNVQTGAITYPVSLSLGLVAGFSSCMAIVGGLVLGIAGRFAEKHPEKTGKYLLEPHIFFNLGRIIGFGLLGGLLGVVGSFFRISLGLNGFLILIASAVMFFVGMQLTELSPAVNKYKVTLPKAITGLIPVSWTQNTRYSFLKTFLAGAATFFLPCGFTQAVQLVAVSSGNAVSGAVLMSLFALGTTPGLLVIGTITSFAKGTWGRKLFRFLGVLVVVLAFFNAGNALALMGAKVPALNIGSIGIGSKNPVRLVNGTQVAVMNVGQSGYSPNKFTVKKDIPVRWVINVSDTRTCAIFIVMPSQNIQKLLTKGENVISFTPTKSGIQRFSCAMGMYSGEFDVQ